MSFFGQSFWQQIVTAIVSGVVLMWISSFFGRGKSRSAKTVLVHAEKTGKVLKAFLIIYRILFWGGLYMFIANLSVHGFDSPYTGLGFSLTFIGLIGLGISKFIRYWRHG